LTQAATRLASGDALVTGTNSTFPDWFPAAGGSDEVAELTQAFRTMAQEVSTRESHLKELFKLLLDSSAQAIYGVDREGNCMFCNPACVRLLGYNDASDLLGRNVHDLLHHSHPDGTPYPASECPLHKSFQDGSAVHRDDEVFWRADHSCL